MFHKLKFPKPITTEQNPRTSTKLFERACDLDQTTGCHYYASALLKPGADQNLHKAAEAFGKACDKGWFFLLRLLLIVAMWKTFLWNKYFTFFSRIIIGFINLQCLLM